MSSTDKSTGAPHKAGAFDIRTFIALLIGIYGVVLTIAGIIGPSQEALDKADGLNINLYAGIGMVLAPPGGRPGRRRRRGARRSLTRRTAEKL